jgi:hypothetical protein
LLWSFVYLVVRNLFALVWLLGRPRRSKELEILVLRHELAILRRQAARPAESVGSCTAGGAEPHAAPAGVDEFRGQAGDAAAVAPTARLPSLDLSAPQAGQAAARPRRCEN